MKHIKAEHEGVRYECDQCDNKAKEKSNLKKHIDGEHKGLVVASKTFPCSQCDLAVSTSVPSASQSCELCNYKAALKSSLKIHMKSDHERVQYNCELCDYKAAQKGNLKRHVKSVHENRFTFYNLGIFTVQNLSQTKVPVSICLNKPKC